MNNQCIYKKYMKERSTARRLIKKNKKIKESKSKKGKKENNLHIQRQATPSVQVSIPIEHFNNIEDRKTKPSKINPDDFTFKIPKPVRANRTTTTKLRMIRYLSRKDAPTFKIVENFNNTAIENTQVKKYPNETLNLIENINIEDIRMPEEVDKQDSSVENASKITMESKSLQTEEVYIINKDDREILNAVKETGVTKIELEKMLKRYAKIQEESKSSIVIDMEDDSKVDKTKEAIYKMAVELSEQNKKTLISEMDRIRSSQSDNLPRPTRPGTPFPSMVPNDPTFTPNSTPVFVTAPPPAFAKASSTFQLKMQGLWLNKMIAQYQRMCGMFKNNEKVQNVQTAECMTQTENEEQNKKRKLPQPTNPSNEINKSIVSTEIESIQNKNHQFVLCEYQPMQANQYSTEKIEQLPQVSDMLPPNTQTLYTTRTPMPPTLQQPQQHKTPQRDLTLIMQPQHQKILQVQGKPTQSSQRQEGPSQNQILFQVLAQKQQSNAPQPISTQMKQPQFQAPLERLQQFQPISSQLQEQFNHLPKQSQQYVHTKPKNNYRNTYVNANRSMNIMQHNEIQFHPRDPRRQTSQTITVRPSPAREFFNYEANYQNPQSSQNSHQNPNYNWSYQKHWSNPNHYW